MRQYEDLRAHLDSGIHGIDNLLVGNIDVCLDGNEPGVEPSSARSDEVSASRGTDLWFR